MHPSMFIKTIIFTCCGIITRYINLYQRFSFIKNIFSELTSESPLLNTTFPEETSTIINLNESPNTDLFSLVTNRTISFTTFSAVTSQVTPEQTSSETLSITSLSSPLSPTLSVNSPVILVTPSHNNVVETVHLSEIKPSLASEHSLTHSDLSHDQSSESSVESMTVTLTYTSYVTISNDLAPATLSLSLHPSNSYNNQTETANIINNNTNRNINISDHQDIYEYDLLSTSEEQKPIVDDDKQMSNDDMIATTTEEIGTGADTTTTEIYETDTEAAIDINDSLLETTTAYNELIETTTHHLEEEELDSTTTIIETTTEQDETTTIAASEQEETTTITNLETTTDSSSTTPGFDEETTTDQNIFDQTTETEETTTELTRELPIEYTEPLPRLDPDVFMDNQVQEDETTSPPVYFPQDNSVDMNPPVKFKTIDDQSSDWTHQTSVSVPNNETDSSLQFVQVVPVQIEADPIRNEIENHFKKPLDKRLQEASDRINKLRGRNDIKLKKPQSDVEGVMMKGEDFVNLWETEISVKLNITEEARRKRNYDEDEVTRQDYSVSGQSAPADDCYVSTTCSSSCGTGFKLLLPDKTSSSQCGEVSLQVLPCSAGPCPRHCVWSAWSEWSRCSRSGDTPECTQGRGRQVLEQEEAGGRSCQGDTEEIRYCLAQDCLGKFEIQLNLNKLLKYVFQVTLALRDLRDILEWMVLMGRKDIQELQVKEEEQAGVVLQASQASSPRMVKMVCLVLLVLQVTQVAMVKMELRVNLVLWDPLDQLVNQDLQARMDRQGILVNLV